MRSLSTLVALLLPIADGGAASPASPPAARHAPAPTDTAWRERVRAWAHEHLAHTAWGPAHSRRDFALSVRLARAEGLAVDEDALYAAAWLHDLGAFPAFARPGVDHADVAAARVGEVLAGTGFPMAKLPLVQAIVARHMYYHEAGATPEAIVFRDADILDFLGATGTARVLSLATRHRWAPSLPDAIATVRRHLAELPATLATAEARRLAVPRLAAMRAFLAALEEESPGGI